MLQMFLEHRSSSIVLEDREQGRCVLSMDVNECMYVRARHWLRLFLDRLSEWE